MKKEKTFTYCDRCGCDYEPNNLAEETILRTKGDNEIITLEVDRYPNKKLDLCDACDNGLSDFWRQVSK
jgi:hypothetical protein